MITYRNTVTPNEKNIDKKWHVIDAQGAVLGRLATTVANLLRGKHKALFTPHADAGDFVVVINAAAVKLTGAKADSKVYWRHSQYPGGIKKETFKERQAAHPERVITEAVRRMLPHGPLGYRQLTKLKVYPGAEHPHAAQNPTVFPLTDKAATR